MHLRIYGKIYIIIMIKLVVVVDNTNIACFNTNVSSYNYQLKAM